MGNCLNLAALTAYANTGVPQRMAVELLMEAAKSCPMCGGKFLPQTHNQKYCGYRCRNDSAAELRHWRKHNEQKTKSR